MTVKYQNYLINDFDTEENGNKAVGVDITIFNEGTRVKANLFDEQTSPISNPVTTNSEGYYSFYIDVGKYDFVVNVGTDSEYYLYQSLDIGESGGGGEGAPLQVYRVPAFSGTQFTLPSNLPDLSTVAKDGRQLTPDEEYSISGLTVTLTTAVTDSNVILCNLGGGAEAQADIPHNETTGRSELNAHDGIYVRRVGSVADMKALAYTVDDVGTVVRTDEFLEGSGYGGEEYRIVLTSSVVPNGNSVIASTAEPLISYVINELKLDNLNASIIPKKHRADPSQYGVTYGINLTQAQQEENTAALNECLEQCGELIINGDIEIYDSAQIRSGRSIEGQSRSTCSIRGKHPTNPTFTDGTVDQPNSQNNNTRDVIIRQLKIESANSHCFYVTPYQWTWDLCRFSCDSSSSAIKYHDGGYQVENYITHNYFVNCGRGIDTFNVNGFRTSTDQHILDNQFFNSGQLDSATKMYIPSGSRFDGNHYYGGAAEEFVYFSGGFNVRLANEYYEQMDNARIRINLGNPSEFNIVGCSFWGGNGNNIDHKGDQSHLIGLQFSTFNNCSVSMSSNSFTQGTNNVPIFGLLNGQYDELGGSQVQFDKSNLVNAVGYKKAADMASSGFSNQSRNVVQSDHPQFRVISANGIPVFSRGEGSEYLYTYNSGNALETISLPSSPRWAANKPLIIRNASPSTTLRMGGATPVNGYFDIAPGTSGSIIQDPVNSNEYLVIKIG